MDVKDLALSSGGPFSIDNIPFGIISTTSNPEPRCATAIGDFAVDLAKYVQQAELAALKVEPAIFANVRSNLLTYARYAEPSWLTLHV